MVLKSRDAKRRVHDRLAANFVAPSRRRARGFTLVELILAIVVAALVGTLAFRFHHDFGKALRSLTQRFQRGDQAQVWKGVLTRELTEGNGLLEVSPTRLAFVSQVGKVLRLEKSDTGSVLWNGQPLPLVDLVLEAEGPDCASAKATDAACRALLDTLDQNRDDTLNLDEMDSDRDGVVRGPECLYVRLITVRWREVAEGPWHTLVLHPRQRLPGLPDSASIQ